MLHALPINLALSLLRAELTHELTDLEQHHVGVCQGPRVYNAQLLLLRLCDCWSCTFSNIVVVDFAGCRWRRVSRRAGCCGRGLFSNSSRGGRAGGRRWRGRRVLLFGRGRRVCLARRVAGGRVDGSRAILLIGFPRKSQLVEGAQGGQDRASDPRSIGSFGRCHDLATHRGGSHVADFLLQPIGQAWKHGRATTQNNVPEQVLSNVYVTCHDGPEGEFVHAQSINTEVGRMEQSLRHSKSLVADGDDLPVRELVARFGGGLTHRIIKVLSHIAELFLDVADDVSFGGGRETVASLRHDPHREVSQDSTTETGCPRGVGKCIALVDRNDVDRRVTDGDDETGRPPAAIKLQDRTLLHR
mmetsp:Transcript_41152/g.88422  ORF Transcript_41152/g.88422 Transcript_41152/m.88422 type:complete len:358 (+) Transcript_41152:381-1454(+)